MEAVIAILLVPVLVMLAVAWVVALFKRVRVELRDLKYRHQAKKAQEICDELISDGMDWREAQYEADRMAYR